MINFSDSEHEERFYNLISKDKTSMSDAYRLSMFYILSGVDGLYKAINNIYNFEMHQIELVKSVDGKPELNTLWFSGGELAALRLAYNLYNGFSDKQSAVDDIFCYTEYFALFLNAIAIRFDVDE